MDNHLKVLFYADMASPRVVTVELLLLLLLGVNSDALSKCRRLKCFVVLFFINRVACIWISLAWPDHYFRAGALSLSV